MLQLRAEVTRKDQEINDLKSQLTNWKSSSTAMGDVQVLKEKLLQEQYKTLKSADEAKMAANKAFWDNMKMVGATVTAVASAVVAVVALQNKKGK